MSERIPIDPAAAAELHDYIQHEAPALSPTCTGLLSAWVLVAEWIDPETGAADTALLASPIATRSLVLGLLEQARTLAAS